MVNVALFTALVALFYMGFTQFSRKRRSWYNERVKHYKTSKGGGLPNIPAWMFSIIWFIIYMLLAISLYIYFDGNCVFNRFDNFQEDDEVSDDDWVRGLLVFLFMLLTFFLAKLWPRVFFKEKQFGVAAMMIVLMIAFSVTVLYSMGSTGQCRRDHIPNRYWISFGLYLIFVIWLGIALIINALWVSVLGWTTKKSHCDYARFCEEKKKCRSAAKTLLYTPVQTQSPSAQYSYNMY